MLKEKWWLPFLTVGVILVAVFALFYIAGPNRHNKAKEKRKKERISISVKKIILSHITMTQMSERRISSMFNQSPRFS